MLRVRWDMQALKVQKDKKESKVIMEWMGHQGSGVARARLAPEVRQDLQVLERKATKVLLGIMGLWALKVNLDFLDSMEHQVLGVSVASQGNLGLKGTEDLLDSKDLKVNLVTWVSEALKVILVYKVFKVQLEREESKGQWGCLEPMD